MTLRLVVALALLTGTLLLPPPQQPVVEVPASTALRRAQGVLSLPKDETGDAPRWQGAEEREYRAIFERRATQPAGMQRWSNAVGTSTTGCQPIVVDGRFDEWDNRATATWGATGPPDSPMGFREVRVASDEHFVHLYLELTGVAAIQGMDGEMRLAIDADGREQTGRTIDDLPGADFVIVFSPQHRLGTTEIRAGIDLRLAVPRQDGSRSTPYDVGFVSQPGYASRRFEMRLERGRDLAGVGRVFSGESWRGRFTYETPDQRDSVQSAVFTERLPRFVPPSEPAQPNDPLTRAPGTTMRVVAWNVSRNNVFTRADRFARILDAIDADIVALDEVAGTYGTLEVEHVLAGVTRGRYALPFAFGEGGNDQRVVLASRKGLESVPALSRIDHSPDALASLARRYPSPWVARETAAARRGGLGALGALLRFDGRRLLTVAVDLRCCGRPFAFEDDLRIVEAHRVRLAVSEAIRRSHPDGVLIVGDFNLIGTRTPRDILVDGLDPDGSSLTVAPVLQLDARTATTWRDPTVPPNVPIFAPTQMDFGLYGDSSLVFLGGFVLDVDDLAPRWRDAHGLQVDDSRETSDHLPIVLDFRWR